MTNFWSEIVGGVAVIGLAVVGWLLLVKGKSAASRWYDSPATSPQPYLFLLGVCCLGFALLGLAALVLVVLIG